MGMGIGEVGLWGRHYLMVEVLVMISLVKTKVNRKHIFSSIGIHI